MKIDPLDVVSEAILNLASASVSLDFDERVASAEVQLSKAIDLKAGIVETVIAPSRLAGSKPFCDGCKKWAVSPIYYRFKRATPEARTEVIYEKLGMYYKKRKFF